MQRHAVLIDKQNAAEWTPLLYLGEDQGKFWVYDTLLSEYAAMGFEYGYSVERPDALVLWEAQFGDFVNGAQTIIDEFISSSEQKWGQRSSVVLLLPHGYEGQGPDHSSARIERFLHDVRREQHDGRLPLDPGVVLPPAAPPGLRAAPPPAHRLHPEVDAAPQGREQRRPRTSRPAPSARSCPTSAPPREVTRVLIAAGKVVYDLLAERDKRGDTSTAMLRLEQYYPLPAADLAEELAKYPGAEVVVVQDEPKNQGAWPFLALNLPEALAEHGEHRALRVISRAASASPATGSTKKHQAEQADLVAQAFDR